MGFIIKDRSKAWLGGIIPYEIDNSDFPPNSDQFLLIESAVSEWNTSSCGYFCFVPRRGEVDYVRFVAGTEATACSSSVGRKGGMQEIFCSLSSKRTILHEMGHAVGLKHEHQRWDRDMGGEWGVRINSSNIVSGKEGNFTQLSPADYFSVGRYDFQSLMHYSSTAFGREENGQKLVTIVTGSHSDGGNFGRRDPQFPIGRQTGLSAGDIMSLRWLHDLATPKWALEDFPGLVRFRDRHDRWVGWPGGPLANDDLLTEINELKKEIEELKSKGKKKKSKS